MAVPFAHHPPPCSLNAPFLSFARARVCRRRPGRRFALGLATLDDGRALAAGGYSHVKQAHLRSAEVYDAALRYAHEKER